jgi:hypothetical protein
MIINLLAVALFAATPADTARFAPGVEYRIEARLDESTAVLHGRAEMRYTNNSRVPLDTIWVHQHLNAFRPNSAWAQRELEFGGRRFQDLGPEQHAFERLTRLEIDGREVRPVYPGAPDSTVVAFPLPARLAPGSTAVVGMDWQARLAELPRRQGRAGRHYDWAHWYPRIAVFNRDGWQTQALVPQGEFFGEFASYDVTLELADDQVIGATGVPVEGDPGWARRARERFDVVRFDRDIYPATAARPLGLLATAAETGNRRIRWRAEDVHHFAWSVNPDFVYEGGYLARSDAGGEQIALHVLFRPQATDWANGVVLQRTITALDWLQDLFGPYPWPQMTTVHRLESGGTEFPMLVMNGSPSEGLIVHEAAHQYLHGILANNEFRDGWLDEGFTSYLTDWYFELQGEPDVWEPTMRAVLQWEQAGRTQQIALPGPEFVDMNTYSVMTYAKAALVFRMLHWMIGDDQFRLVLREFYDRHALSHVDEMDLRRVVNDVTGEDLDWFFRQWLHTTAQLDYRIDAATTARRPDGRWATQVVVHRAGDAWMPVDLRVGDTTVRLASRDREQMVEVVTDTQPREVVLDPERILIDVDPRSNRAVPTVF